MRRFPWTLAALLDAAVIVGFATTGISTHSGEIIADLLRVVWPFAVGAALGWLVSIAWKAPAAPVRAGVTVWFFAAGCGMILRVATGGGFAWTFFLVTALVLFAGIVGWRLIAAGIDRILARRRVNT